MPDVTEIYICKHGQRLEDGKLEISREIHSRTDAEEDAREICGKDQTVYRIAYYAIDDDGEFRLYFTHINPAAEPEEDPWGPLPPGVRPTVFIRKRHSMVRIWFWFKSLWR